MNEITTRTEQGVVLISPDVMNTAGLYLNQIERRGAKTFLAEPPTGRTLLLLRRAADAAHASLRPIDMASAEMQRAREAIAAMFVGRHFVNEDPMKMTEAYLQHVKDLPLFAILAALVDVKQGSTAARALRILPGKYPETDQLWQLANEKRRALAMQHDQLADVIEAKKIERKAAPPMKSTVGEHEASRRMDGVLQKVGTPTEEEKKRREGLNEESIRRNEQMVRRDYAIAKIEPFVSRGGAVLALPLARQMERDGMLRLEHAGGRPGWKQFVLSEPKPAPDERDGNEP